MKHLIKPHGGTLVNRYISHTTGQWQTFELDNRAYCDLHMIASGAYSPLTGFLEKDDYNSVVNDMRLQDGTLWPAPVVLPVTTDLTSELKGSIVHLTRFGKTVASMHVKSVYKPNKNVECEKVYKTNDDAHPGVKYVKSCGETYLGGPIFVTEEFNYTLPTSLRQEFEKRGWETVVGFQTRNPMHRAHEYITKCALEICDGLLIHPLVGHTKADDISAEVRMDCYKALIDNYYPADRVMLSEFPSAMRYAGPREAILHAIARQNYGCTHFIIGRDHAGVGKYYGTYDAQKIFDNLKPGDLDIVPLKFEHAFYSTKLGGMGTSKTAPGDVSTKIFLSGTKVREMLSRGEQLPEEFTRPEVAAILSQNCDSQ